MANSTSQFFTSKERRLIKYDEIISKHQKYFKQNSSFTRQQFVEIFEIPNIKHTGTYQELQRSNLNLVKAQVEINLLLRENGMYLASSNYYQNFKIHNKERTKHEIIRYSAEVDISSACTTRLEHKLKNRLNAGTWGVYQKVPGDVIYYLAKYSASDRHKQTRTRVKHF